MSGYCSDCGRTLEENDDGDPECPGCGLIDKEWF